MKINQLYMVCGVLLLGAATLAGCSNEERYDVDGDNANRVFFNPAAAEVSTFTIYHTPVGEFGAVEAGYPIKLQYASEDSVQATAVVDTSLVPTYNEAHQTRSEEHTSELQSRQYLVCRLLLEKQKPRTALLERLLSV